MAGVNCESHQNYDSYQLRHLLLLFSKSIELGFILEPMLRYEIEDITHFPRMQILSQGA
jgi:hypothetical protein